MRSPVSGRLALAAALCAAAGVARPLAAQSGRSWQPGDRVLITRFAEVGAVAADLRTLYAASILGLERRDYAAGRWLAPVTILDGYPAGERPSALAVDQASYTLWLATSAGGLYAYDLSFGRWRRVPLAATGAISTLVPSIDGLWLAAGAQWLRLRPGSSFADPVATPDVPASIRSQAGSPLERAARADPFLGSNLGALAVTDRARHYSVTSAVAGERPGMWWLGTWGGNILRFDGHTGDTQRLEFGTLSPGISAVAQDGAAIWFGGDARTNVTGVTRASSDLATWQSWDPADDGAPASPVLDILPARDVVWFAAADGLYRFDRRAQRFSRLDERDGLPSSWVLTLAPAADGVWAGTRQGLALVDGGGKVHGRILAGRAIHGLSLVSDTLWISSDAGLLLLPDVTTALAGGAPAAGDSAAAVARDSAGVGGDTVMLQPVPAGAAAALHGRVLAALPAAATVWAATEDGLWRRDPAAGWMPVRDGALSSIGRPLTLAADAAGLWVAGATGIARYDATGRSWRSYTVGPDLPAGPVSDVLASGDYVWAATPAGAVRLPRRF